MYAILYSQPAFHYFYSERFLCFKFLVSAWKPWKHSDSLSGPVSDMTAIKEVWGDFLQFTNTFASRDPRSLKELLLLPDESVRSCFIVVQSINMKEELLTKSSSTDYQDLLKAASLTVGKNVLSLTFFPECFINCCTRSNCWGRGQPASCLPRIN